MRAASSLIATTVLAFGTSTTFGAQSTPTAFVGSLISIAEIECESGDTVDPATGDILTTICMDALYQATYRVEKVLEGKLIVGSEVTFSVADHYGFPKFAEQKRALLFLAEHQGRYFHIKYQWVPVYRTNEGDFAQCGCDTGDDSEESQSNRNVHSGCRALSFSPAVTQDLTHSSQYFIDKIRSEADYRIEGNHAVCARGVGVENVYRQLRPHLMEVINAR